MSYDGYWGYAYKKSKPKDPAKQLEKLRKKNPDIDPVQIEGSKLAKNWWGMAWNRNLERYADYSNRIGRGKSYVRQGMVLDLQIEKGKISALVCGSSAKPYAVKINIRPLSKTALKKITNTCSNQIKNLEELLEGHFSKELGELFLCKDGGFFPSPKEIKFSCSCPDSAYMCKHVAATLYGVGARLDKSPLLFFTLRGISADELLKQTADERVKSLLSNANCKTDRVIREKNIEAIFGAL